MTTATTTEYSRDEAIAAIRVALRQRSGRTWSLRGGRGTAYGWITIIAPPARCDRYGAMTDDDRAELSRVFGIPLGQVHGQGLMVEPTQAARREYVTRATTGTAPCGRVHGGPCPNYCEA